MHQRLRLILGLIFMRVAYFYPEKLNSPFSIIFSLLSGIVYDLAFLKVLV
jgi:hypothetical protein